jgi:prephenate dehydrogenase
MLGKKITIIGGSGGLGRIFSKFFKKNGFEVTLLARNEEKLKRVAHELNVNFEFDLEKSVADANIVMISIPIRDTPEMIKKIAPFLKKNTLLFEISSLKFATIKSLKEICENYPINCISLHPMFGPGVETLENLVLVYIKIGGTEEYEQNISEFLNLFENEGLILTESSPEIHDTMIALTLGVPHMFNILFLNLLKESNQPIDELMKYTGTTFLLQKIFSESVIQREVEMFGEIQMDNVQFHKILNMFEKLLKLYKKTIKNKDMDEFKKLFSNGINYSENDKHFKDAYKYFYEFIKILKKEDS